MFQPFLRFWILPNDIIGRGYVLAFQPFLRFWRGLLYIDDRRVVAVVSTLLEILEEHEGHQPAADSRVSTLLEILGLP